MRVFPILDWSYSDVWAFLKNYAYCELYDQGYTSLGEIHNSQKNPHLEKEDGTFSPAYALKNDDYERYSRRDTK